MTRTIDEDFGRLMRYAEVHFSKCGANPGARVSRPEPTGPRYCIKSASPDLKREE